MKYKEKRECGTFIYYKSYLEYQPGVHLMLEYNYI